MSPSERKQVPFPVRNPEDVDATLLARPVSVCEADNQHANATFPARPVSVHPADNQHAAAPAVVPEEEPIKSILKKPDEINTFPVKVNKKLQKKWDPAQSKLMAE